MILCMALGILITGSVGLFLNRLMVPTAQGVVRQLVEGDYQPRVGVTVYLVSPGIWTPALPHIVQTTTTDDNGQFRFYGSANNTAVALPLGSFEHKSFVDGQSYGKLTVCQYYYAPGTSGWYELTLPDQYGYQALAQSVGEFGYGYLDALKCPQ